MSGTRPVLPFEVARAQDGYRSDCRRWQAGSPEWLLTLAA